MNNIKITDNICYCHNDASQCNMHWEVISNSESDYYIEGKAECPICKNEIIANAFFTLNNNKIKRIVLQSVTDSYSDYNEIISGKNDDAPFPSRCFIPNIEIE